MRAWRVAAVLALAATPAGAQAHQLTTGLGPAYDAVAHFGVTPQDVLPVAALGLFAGLRGPAASRALLATLPVAWLAGGGLALAGAAPAPLLLEGATALLFLAVGLLLAINADPPRAACVATAAALGLVRGLADARGLPASAPQLAALAAVAAGAAVTFALAASLTLPLRRAWQVVVVRVGGSWLAASGLLLAGWLIRYGAAAV